MKQYIKFIAAAFAIVAAASCQKETLAPSANGSAKLVPLTINATLNDTKAALQADRKVFWEANDSIAVWAGGTKYVFKLTSGAGSTNASFSGEVAAGTTVTSAVYPYASAGSTEDAALSVPSVQTIAEGAICDPAAGVMKAVYEGGSLPFKNEVGGVRFTMPAGADRITLTSGEQQVVAKVPGTAGEFVAFLAPGEYEGITMCVSLSSTSHAFKSSANKLTIEKGKIVNIGAASSASDVVDNTISTAEQLVKWAQVAPYYSGGETVYVAADIDLSTLNGGQNYAWTPVRYLGNFEGKDGKVYTIKGYEVKASNQKYSSDDYMYLGFFGYLSGGLKHLQFGTKGNEDAVVIADENETVGTSNHLNVGGVIGRCKYGWMEDVTSYATIKHTATSYKVRIAGICGHFQSANSTDNAKYSMLNCTFGGKIDVDGTIAIGTNYVGGLVGYSQASIHIRNCTNLGSVKINARQDQAFYAGGIIAQLGSSSSGNSAVISGCRNGSSYDPSAEPLVQVTVGGSKNKSTKVYKYLGGIAGCCYATISYCFNYANIAVAYGEVVDDTWTTVRCGGICGYETTSKSLNMDNCASLGTVYGGFVNDTRANTAGLIGYGQAHTGIVRNCFVACSIISEGNGWARTGIVCGTQAASGNYGTDDEPIYILKGMKLANNYTAGKEEVVIDASNVETYLQGTSSGKTNVYKYQLVESIDAGLAKLKDSYAE